MMSMFMVTNSTWLYWLGEPRDLFDYILELELFYNCSMIELIEISGPWFKKNQGVCLLSFGLQ